MYPLQELRVDKELPLCKRLFRPKGGMITQSPEFVGVITIGCLKTGDPCFPGEEYSGVKDEDQLFSKRIEGQEIDIGGSDGTVVFFRFEKTGGNSSKAPIRLQGLYHKGKNKEVSGTGEHTVRII